MISIESYMHTHTHRHGQRKWNAMRIIERYVHTQMYGWRVSQDSNQSLKKISPACSEFGAREQICVLINWTNIIIFWLMWCAVLVAQTQSINTGPRLCYFLYFFFGFSFRLFFFFLFFFRVFVWLQKWKEIHIALARVCPVPLQTVSTKMLQSKCEGRKNERNFVWTNRLAESHCAERIHIIYTEEKGKKAKKRHFTVFLYIP